LKLDAAALKEEAAREGLFLLGATTLDPLPHREVYECWLEAGRHGSMAYLGTERARRMRAFPQELLPQARSLVICALPYAVPGGQADAPARAAAPLRGRVAAYAWGDDYHEVFPVRLESLARRLQARLGSSFAFRAYTDTGPLLERDLAQRAGLGWAGKNTCLISPRHGSLFFLGELLLEPEVQVDTPFVADRCGSCRRCIEACPTGCILEDRTLDARRCISYQTIENRGPIPRGLRSEMGTWIFGCDVCQIVCPWNQRFARPEGALPAFQAREGVPSPDLIEALGLGPQEFSRRFRHSAVKRAHLTGFLRNAAVALGNLRDPRAIPALAGALRAEREPLVRSHAAWALGQISGLEARQALREAAPAEKNSDVLAELDLALSG
jgi:epoxyqueuosine reductase